MLIYGYNVTFDYEANTLTLSLNKVVPASIDPGTAWIYLFGALMITFILLAILFIYLVLYKKGKTPGAVNP
jgi:predicted membrane protein